MKPIHIPNNYNYLAIFLTMSCNYKCSYCINIQGKSRGVIHNALKPMSSKDWIKALNRIETRASLPITLQGGEPTCHPEFYKIANGVEKPMDLLTNGSFNVFEFMENIHKSKFRRKAPYASIRLSYHPSQETICSLIIKANTLKQNGYQVGIWLVEPPDNEFLVGIASENCTLANIDFRVKDYLGYYKNKLLGCFKYKDSMNGKLRDCFCKTSELIIGPDGTVYRCHSDLYNLRSGIGHILDKDFGIYDAFIPCENYGTCNPCDVKITTNRHQVFGHTSVNIIGINDGRENCPVCMTEVRRKKCSNTKCAWRKKAKDGS